MRLRRSVIAIGVAAIASAPIASADAFSQREWKWLGAVSSPPPKGARPTRTLWSQEEVRKALDALPDALSPETAAAPLRATDGGSLTRDDLGSR